MADNRDNRMLCPECGGTWRVTGRSKESERYYRTCSTCGHKGTTGRNGAPPEPKKVTSLPCPKCHTPVWYRHGGNPSGTHSYHVCHLCGRKGTVDRATGKEVHKRGEWYRCPDCSGVARLIKHRYSWEERTCECCGLQCVREKKSDVVHRRAEWAAANPHRLPREERPRKETDPDALAAKEAKAAEKAAKAAAYNLERARKQAQKVEEKRVEKERRAAKQREAARTPRVQSGEKKPKEARVRAGDIVSPEGRKQTAARRSIEDLRMERRLFGTDPLAL